MNALMIVQKMTFINMNTITNVMNLSKLRHLLLIVVISTQKWNQHLTQ